MQHVQRPQNSGSNQMDEPLSFFDQYGGIPSKHEYQKIGSYKTSSDKIQSMKCNRANVEHYSEKVNVVEFQPIKSQFEGNKGMRVCSSSPTNIKTFGCLFPKSTFPKIDYNNLSQQSGNHESKIE